MMSRAESVSSKLILILIVIFIFNPANAEDVCKLFYNQYPEELKGQKVIVPDNTVALSEYVRVGSPLIVMEPPPEGISIFFIIDHSASMTNKGKDPLGNRFSVLYDLIDTINVHLPKSEVGLAVFRQDLCFSDEDSPYFVKAPNFKVNSYLQLMKLDSVYEGNNVYGADIVRKYLESEIGPDGIGDMVYKHKLPYQQYNTNINCGFDAAKDALNSSTSRRYRQFIVFISDGEANQPQDGTKNEFSKGENCPTTFTIYFPRHEDVPQSIKLMTENVQKNGYSSSNHLSKYWRYVNRGKKDLKDFVMKNIMSAIFKTNFKTKIELKPDIIYVNSKAPVEKWDTLGYKFEKMFPLTGKKTDFSQKLHYKVFKYSVNILDDTVQTESADEVRPINFSVEVDRHAEELDSVFVFECWDRKFQFYHDGKPIDVAHETMGELEIRFIENKIDILYGYKNVKVDINNTETPKNDLEKFILEDKGSYFTFKFKRNFKSIEHGDQTLSHAFEDSIIATFRNPELPLDTLRYGIPFRISGTVIPEDLEMQKPKLIKVITPNGREKWNGGEIVTIEWITSGDTIENVKIEFSKNRGENWITIEKKYPNNREYKWKVVEQVTSEECKIRISHSDLDLNFLKDESDGTFTVMDDDIPIINYRKGRKEFSPEQIRIFPNPTHKTDDKVINFSLVTPLKIHSVEISIYDALGNHLVKIPNYNIIQNNGYYRLNSWNLLTQTGRQTYSGSYLAVFTITYREGNKSRFAKIIGIDQ